MMMACDDAGRTDAVATATDCSSAAHVVQVQLQVPGQCTRHHERVCTVHVENYITSFSDDLQSACD